MLDLLESSATLVSSSVAIFQWNNTLKHVRLRKSDINSICQYLTEDATKMTHVSCPDFTAAIPYWQDIHSVVKPLQEVQNSAAKLVLKSCRVKHCTPLLKQLHWLPIEQRIKYKIVCLCYQIITDLGTWLNFSWAMSLLGLHSFLGDRTFHIPCFSAAQIWNFLPFALCHSPSLPAFKSNL